MLTVILRRPTLFCASSFLIFAWSLALAADTDAVISTNAGFSPYLLQAELRPSDPDMFFGRGTSISNTHAAVLVQSGLDADNAFLNFFDEALDGASWFADDRAMVSNGRGISEGPNDYQSCFSVAGNGDNFILGEPTLTIFASYYGQGGASFFQRSAKRWDFEGMLTDPTPEEGQFFGCSVAISGTTAVIGAPWAAPLGAVFVANFDGRSWLIVQKITPPEDSPTYFGSAVAVSANRIVVGAPGDGYGIGVDSPAVAYVFDRGNDAWKISAKIVAQDMVAGDDFAHSVAVDGDNIVVGARAKNQNAGALYIYRFDTGSWVLAKEFVETVFPGRQPHFGFSVSLQGDRLIVGEPGLARSHLFQRIGTNWFSRSTFSTEGMDSQFGFSVGVSGRKLIVGAPLTDGGRAYIFRDDQLFSSGFEQ